MLRSLPGSDFQRSALLMLDQSKSSQMPADGFFVRTCWFYQKICLKSCRRCNLFELSCVAGVDFWSEVGPHSEQVDLMVEPSQVSKVNPYVITSAFNFGTTSQESFCLMYIYHTLLPINKYNTSFIFTGCQSNCLPKEQWHWLPGFLDLIFVWQSAMV